MRVTLVGINAKYAHTNPAIRMLVQYSGSSQADFVEFTINMDKDEVVQKLLARGSDAYGISLYIWNAAFGKYLGNRLKRAGKLVFYGGPEAANHKEALFCDFAFTGEGEEPFRQWIERFAKGQDWRDVCGIAYKIGDKLIENPAGQLVDMDDLPLAYEGQLDQMKNRLVYYESSRGCPFRCSYCLSAGENRVRYRSLERTLADMDRLIDGGVMKVKFVDRTFNADKKRAGIVIRHIIGRNPATDFHLEMAPDLVDEETIGFFRGARKGLFRIELGIQSTNPKTLAAINRRQNLDKVARAVGGLSQYATVHVDLIAGLPLEDYASFQNSFDTVMKMGPHVLQLGFLKVLKGSPLERDAGKYGIEYNSSPPYEVIRTASIEREELDALRRVEYALERVYNAGLFRHTARYFSQDGFFRFFEAFSSFACLKGISEDSLGDKLAEYGRKKGYAFSEDMVKLDRLLRKNRPKTKFAPDGHEEERRKIYRDMRLKSVPKGKRPWHYTRIEWFAFDVSAYLERGELVEGEFAVLFDYTGQEPRVEELSSGRR